MRIAIVGFYNQFVYEEAFAVGLEANGIDVVRVDLKRFWRPLFSKFSFLMPSIDFSLRNLNKNLTEYLISKEVDYVLFWRPTHIYPETVKSLSLANIRTISYNNDDPFGHRATVSKNYYKYSSIWYYYLKSLPYFDYNFFYREINRIEAIEYGVKHADLLLPYFIPEKNRKVVLDTVDTLTYQAELTFIGHHEHDIRDEYLMALLSNKFDLKVWGGKEWKKSLIKTSGAYKSAIEMANGEKYEMAICGAKICLVFLSHLNRDNYTRRCFEIPACEAVMLAPRTPELTKFYTEDVEACFFENSAELIEKAEWLLGNDQEREKIAKAGNKKVWALGASVYDRADQFVKCLDRKIEV